MSDIEWEFIAETLYSQSDSEDVVVEFEFAPRLSIRETAKRTS